MTTFSIPNYTIAFREHFRLNNPYECRCPDCFQWIVEGRSWHVEDFLEFVTHQLQSSFRFESTGDELDGNYAYSCVVDVRLLHLKTKSLILGEQLEIDKATSGDLLPRFECIDVICERTTWKDRDIDSLRRRYGQGGFCKACFSEKSFVVARLLLMRYATFLIRSIVDRKMVIEDKERKVAEKIARKEVKAQYVANQRLLKTERARLAHKKGRVATGERKLKVRWAVLVRDGFRCRYCGRDSSEVKLHVDHVVPRSQGGESEVNNYVTACEDCNLGKRDKLLVGDGKKKRISIAVEGQLMSPLAIPFRSDVR